MSSWRKFLTGQPRELAHLLPPPATAPLIPPPPPHRPHLEQHRQPPPTCSCPPPYFFFLYTNLRSLSHPVENQHVAPGHKSGLCEVDLQCLVFTSSSFSPLCHSAPPPNLFSSLPPSSPDQLAPYSLSHRLQTFRFFFYWFIELMPRKWNQTRELDKFMRSDAQKVQILLLNLFPSLFFFSS